MTRVKLCGMMRPEDIQAVNEIKPEYIGFMFAKKSRRYVSKEQAKMLKEMLDPAVKAVGVFVNESVENVKRPYFLAGGLDPENVRDAVERLRPFGVDVSSGIESFGVKDALKMAKFVATVRKGSGSNAFP